MKIKYLYIAALVSFLMLSFQGKAQETLPDSVIERSLAEEDPIIEEPDSMIQFTKLLNNLLVHASLGYNYIPVKQIDAAPFKQYSSNITNPLPLISPHNLNYGLSGLLNLNKFLLGIDVYATKTKKTTSKDLYSSCTGRFTNKSFFVNSGFLIKAKNFIFTPLLGIGLYQSTLEYSFTRVANPPNNDPAMDYLASDLHINNKSVAMDLGFGMHYLFNVKGKEVEEKKDKKSYEEMVVIQDINNNVISLGIKVGFNAILGTYDAYNSLNKIENKFVSSGPYVKVTLGGGIFN